MDFYSIPFEDFSKHRNWTFTKAPDAAALNLTAILAQNGLANVRSL